MHDFFTVNRPKEAKILVVDGLMPGYGYDSIVSLINQDNYQYIITAGVDLDYFYNKDDHVNIADLSYKVLLKKEIHGIMIEKAPAGKVTRDRTYSSAMAVKEWLEAHQLEDENINVISHGAHARRTWLLYRKAFGGKRQIGIISVHDNSYRYDNWYRESKGVRIILSETIAYVYAWLFFWPSNESEKEYLVKSS